MCTNKVDIAAALDPEKFKILNIAQLTSGRTKQPLPLFLIKITNSLVADEILKISSLHGIRVTVESTGDEISSHNAKDVMGSTTAAKTVF
ncbi:hypothetical protein CEXT_89741 [Caerostris extrusa]|uniref:Pre-C2HC domain-containing protein n=1 Tax=Caerostris extrusa TaxID=172846 RepID=A0AAV4Y9M6_CAEEX|nr:hypothetical protein CEXT_89741 [Caerostris extrusa]